MLLRSVISKFKQPWQAVSSFNIVKTYVRRSTIFETCMPHDENWIHSRSKRHKPSKLWNDPNIHWPPVSVRPTLHKGKTLIQ